MKELHQRVRNFLLDRFDGIASAALRATVLARCNLVHKKELSDLDFRETARVLVSVYKASQFTRRASRWKVRECSIPGLDQLRGMAAEINLRVRSIFSLNEY